MNDVDQWVRAFARQSLSDLDAREHLLSGHSDLPACHHLHALQMALEKASKAHLLRNGTPVDVVTSSHAYTRKIIPQIVKHELSQNRDAMASAWVLDAVRSLAERIERLHPQVDRGGAAPDNVEYPWRGPDGLVVAPCDHDFAFPVHNDKPLVAILKYTRQRMQELAVEPRD